MLRGFAELARRRSRAGDLVCRYGGEEFVLVLPGAHAAQATARISQLLNAFGALPFEAASGATFACSFSAGVAVSTGPDDTLPALLARADAALYAAKRAGRARVQLAGAETV